MTRPLRPPGAPERIGKYHLIERLGRGGMAEVFRAEQRGPRGFCRTVAIKRVLADAAPTADIEQLADRLACEAQIIAELRHPNIVALHDCDRDDDGRLILVMELVEGVDLAQLVDCIAGRIGGRIVGTTSASPLPIPIARYITGEVLEALAYAHEHPANPVIHRDVSPHNVLLSRAGRVKLTDFGVARLLGRAADSFAVAGKAPYFAPEVLHGLPLDGRADLFAVGVVLYEMLTGRRPFETGLLAASMASVLIDEVTPPRTLRADVPAELEAVVMRLLVKERAKRFATARDAQRALSAVPGDSASASDLAALLDSLADRFAALPAFTAHHAPPPDAPSIQSAVAPAISIEDDWTTERMLLPPAEVRRLRRRRWLAVGGVAAAVAIGLTAGAYHAIQPQSAPPPAPTAKANPAAAIPARADAPAHRDNSRDPPVDRVHFDRVHLDSTQPTAPAQEPRIPAPQADDAARRDHAQPDGPQTALRSPQDRLENGDATNPNTPNTTDQKAYDQILRNPGYQVQISQAVQGGDILIMADRMHRTGDEAFIRIDIQNNGQSPYIPGEVHVRHSHGRTSAAYVPEYGLDDAITAPVEPGALGSRLVKIQGAAKLSGERITLIVTEPGSRRPIALMGLRVP